MKRLSIAVAIVSVVASLAGCAAITDESPAASPAASPDLREDRPAPQRALPQRALPQAP
ncbi:MAG: hypothetical protein HYU51_19105 [Candidatus Rokubacteria bacterium]|nr:hypothetical protein [Candidatus Rokubacteria bacterium]